MEKNILKSKRIILENSNNNAVMVDHFHKKFKDINIGPFSFNIEKGKVTALLGSSGSGKSVFLNSLLGATLNYDGNIYINGKERKKSSSIENNSNVGFYSQMDFSLYSITAYDFLYNMCNVMGLDKSLVRSRIEYWLKKFDLWTSKDKPLNAFSWGMKNRMNLILCFIKEPEILILDEPGANLDSKWRGQSYKILKEFKEEFNSTIILTVHNIDEVYNIIENFVILEKGKLLFSGSKSELNLYKKINVSFEKDVVLAEVEKLLNQHNILTFKFDLSTNSLVIGLNEHQTFNDALAILEKNHLQPKDVVAQAINMDAISKALEDKEKPHKPKYEPLKEFVIDSSNKSVDLGKALEFLNKIEDKYKNILNLGEDEIKVGLSNDLVLIGDDLSETSAKTHETLVLNDPSYVGENVLTASEINTIKNDFFDKVQELKNLKSEINKIVTEQKTEIDLNIDDLKDYFAKIKLESEIIHQVKTTFEDQATSLKVLLEQTEAETQDLEFKKTDLQIKIDELKALQEEISLTSANEYQQIDLVKDEFSNKLEDLKSYIEKVKIESENSLTSEIESKMNEFKEFENQFKDLVAAQREIIQDEIKDFKSYLTQIQIENDEINNSRDALDKDLNALKQNRDEFLTQVDLEHEEVEMKKLELNEKLDELKKLQEDIAVATIAEYEEIDSIKAEFTNKLIDLKSYVESISAETQIIQESKAEYLEKIKEFKEYHDEFNKTASAEKESIKNSISELKEFMSQIQIESSEINQSKTELEEELRRLKETQSAVLAKIEAEDISTKSRQKQLESQYREINTLQSNIDTKVNLINEGSSNIKEYNLEISKLKEELEKLKYEMNEQQNTKKYVGAQHGWHNNIDYNMQQSMWHQQNLTLLKDQELEKIKSDLNKEKEYFEQLRKEMIFEKELNQKLAKFDSEMKQRENVLELERIRREIQEEKNKLNEVLMMQKFNK
ncbi:ATP-binding cassette domain-containing protein [Mesoplasma coleopterae]|uniref:ABC transporter ATP-binding protein n=1 Tax=Mesoplasma coleopterae TaxID=324078 RepID=A0A2K8P2K3_9MOLU|nr:ATP-binding cassette domain-containing protein [Mesoplasma coleopterae]ATZ20994.1 ABC transporter ATP-binding protein [Mesoplasma coleopterae]